MARAAKAEDFVVITCAVLWTINPTGLIFAGVGEVVFDAPRLAAVGGTAAELAHLVGTDRNEL